MDQYAQRITRDYPVRRKAQEKENMRTYLMGQLRALGYDELGLALKERLPETFLDFAPYLDGCRFVGCSHTKEKGCAVLEAVRAGKLSASRHASYLRLYNELKDLREWSSK